MPGIMAEGINRKTGERIVFKIPGSVCHLFSQLKLPCSVPLPILEKIRKNISDIKPFSYRKLRMCFELNEVITQETNRGLDHRDGNYHKHALPLSDSIRKERIDHDYERIVMKGAQNY